MSMIYNALSGAQAAQAALNMTSQNTANAMTPGYTRQGVLLSAVQPSSRGVNAAGAGVTVSGLIRFSDSYKSMQMWQANSSLGQYEAGQSYLTQLEQVMSDDTSNINQGLDSFFAALNAASVQPDSAPLREQVLTAADGLAKRVNSLQQLLNNQQTSVDNQRNAVISQINGYAADIAALNKQIATGQANGINTSGLQDSRDQRIDDLAALVGLQVVDLPDGTRSVSMRNGQPLVMGSEAGTLSVNSGSLELSFANGSFKVLSTDLSGQLGGLQDYEAQVLKPMKTTISDLAQGITTRFNNQLAAGYAPPATTAGKPLFSYVGGQLSLTSLTASELAFSSSATESGNSANLKSLLALKDATVSLTQFDAQGNVVKDGLGNTVYKSVVLGDTYTQLVGKLGVQSQQNQASQTTAQTVRDQSEENWKSTSGVNQDEEAINLMQFQQMYQANLKVVAVANALFDSTLEMVG